MPKKYTDTLNLFDSPFPMRGNLAKREPDMLRAWQHTELYQQVRKAARGRKTFILHDGPPYANGDLHIGHAINKVLKDIIVRAKTLAGYDAPYIPGWDCHGLPIEHQVEKSGGDRKSPDIFRRQCRAFAETQIEQQKADFIRMGVFGDWNNAYKTMNAITEAGIIRLLGKIYQRGLISHRLKSVSWCVNCESALAEAEIEYGDYQSLAIDVAFAAADNAAVNRVFGAISEKPVFAVIWTTTTWTLPANYAIAIHPKLNYVLVETKDQRRFIVSESLREAALTRWKMPDITVIATVKGAALDGLVFRHPFYNRDSIFITSEHVTAEAGTGLVHTAPGHGEDDFYIGVKHGLPLESPVDGRGHFVASLPLFGGMKAQEAVTQIADTLAQRGQLLAREKYLHSYPKCWRHKSPIMFRTDWQWFVEMDTPFNQGRTLREIAREAIAETTFYPSWGINRIDTMIVGRPDWCLSRQRFWNVPIPFFLHKETGELHPRTAEIIEQAATIVEKGSIEAWFSTDAEAILGKDAVHYNKVRDTLDVWFDSGATHYAVMGWTGDEASRPDLYLEGTDQHRGWFQSSLITACATHGRAPYRQILTHGFVIASDGRKMSKSLNNAISPADIINDKGADILRLWVGASDYSGEIALSDEILKRVVETYRRIRNTIRFLLVNVSDFNAQTDAVAPDDMLEIDRLMLGYAEAFRQTIITQYDKYAFHEMVRQLHYFCSFELGSFYLDILKDRLYTCPQQSHARRSAQSALYPITALLIKVMAPVLCFTADEAWRALVDDDKDSPLLHTWEVALPQASDGETLSRKWAKIEKWRALALREIETKRAAGDIRSSLEAELIFTGDANSLEVLQSLGEEARYVFIVSKVAFIVQPEATPAVTVTHSTNRKCTRCWHHEASVGDHVNHPELCSRCVSALAGSDNSRQFV